MAHPPPPAAPGPPRVRNEWHATTRKGTGICEGYQTGACTEHGLNRICSRDNVSVHVCAVCRRYGHGAQFPRCLTMHPEAAAAPGGAGAGRGAGRGRGRGRAKGGKGRGKNGKQ